MPFTVPFVCAYCKFLQSCWPLPLVGEKATHKRQQGESGYSSGSAGDKSYVECGNELFRVLVRGISCLA